MPAETPPALPETPPAPPAGAGPRGHLGRLIAVVAVIVALTAGWPLISSAISDSRPLTAGAVLAIGPGASHRAQFTVGPGWVLQQSESDPKMNYLLRHGTVRLSVIYVWLVTRGEAGSLWSGLRQLLQAVNSGSRISGPAPVTSSYGAAGLTGLVRQGGQAGIAAIYPAPGRTFAIEMISLGPPGAAGAQAAARQVVRTLRFPAGRP